MIQRHGPVILLVALSPDYMKKPVLTLAFMPAGADFGDNDDIANVEMSIGNGFWRCQGIEA